MAAADSIHLYAELLLNLKSVTFIASINSASTRETQAILVTNGSTLSLTHLDQAASLRLPVKTIGNASATLTLPAHVPKQLSSRLEVDGGNVADLLTLQEETQNCVPWSASNLTESNAVFCSSCLSIIVESGAISEWRDMPSEDWEELSDFWHCHDHLGELGLPATTTQRSQLSSSPRISRGIAFVDSTSFLFSPTDCSSLEVCCTVTAYLVARNAQITGSQEFIEHKGVKKKAVLIPGSAMDWPSIPTPDKN